MVNVRKIYFLTIMLLIAVPVIAQDEGSDSDSEVNQPELRYICDAGGDCTWTPLGQEDIDFVIPDNTYEEAVPQLEGEDGERFVCVETIGCEWSPLSDDDLEIGLGELEYWVADYNEVPDGEWIYGDVTSTECDLAMMNVETMNSGDMTFAAIDDNGTRLQVVARSQINQMDSSASVAGMGFDFTGGGGQGSGTVTLDGNSFTQDLPLELDEETTGSMIFYRIGPGTYTTGIIGIYGNQDGGESFVTFETFISILEDEMMRGFTIIKSNFAGDGMGFSCIGNTTLDAEPAPEAEE